MSPRYVRTLKGGEEHAHRTHDERPRPSTPVEDDGFPSRGGTRYQILYARGRDSLFEAVGLPLL